MSDNFDSFVFTHIPKCGGSSFRKLIFDAAIDSRIEKQQIYIPGEGGIIHESNLNQLSDQKLKRISNIKVLADHTKYSPQFYKQLGIKNPFVFTIFRNPKQRFISHFNFFYSKVGMGNCKGKKIRDLTDEKLISIIKNTANLQTSYLLNLKPGVESREIIQKRFNEIDGILENKIHCFGILEHMDQSISHLKESAPDWLKISKNMPILNTTNLRSKPKVYGRVNKYFPKHNKFDLILYRKAMKILSSKVALQSENN